MSLAGKTDDFELDDLLEFGRFADLKPAETKSIIDTIRAAVSNWNKHCDTAGVEADMARKARHGFRDIG